MTTQHPSPDDHDVRAEPPLYPDTGIDNGLGPRQPNSTSILPVTVALMGVVIGIAVSLGSMMLQ